MYEYIEQFFKLLIIQDKGSADVIISSLSKEEQKYLRELLQRKKVAIQHKGKNVKVNRRMLKPKRRIQTDNSDSMN